MPKKDDTLCVWCDSREPHVPLTEPQRKWLRERIDEKNVDAYLMCAAGDCRKVRKWFNATRFPRRDPVRIPDDVN